MKEKTTFQNLEKEIEQLRNELSKKPRPNHLQLEAANQQLLANEQQLRAANQQLSANEQQLRAANQQLSANEQQLRVINQQLEANVQQLQDSENRLNAFAKISNEGILFSEKGICIEANNAACKLFGYTYDEVIGMFGTDVIAPESADLVKTNMLSGYSKSYDAVALRKDGTKFHGEFHGSMFNWKGKEIRVTSVKDISNRKEQETLLQKRIKFIEFSNIISTDFINRKHSKTDEIIRHLLQQTAQYNKLERAYIYLFSSDEKKLILSHEWCKPEIIPHKGLLESINAKDYQEFTNKLKNKQIIQINISDLKDTPENKGMLDILNLLKIKSFISLPMVIEGKLIGYISFDSTLKERKWKIEMADSLVLCKEIVANTITFSKVEQEIRKLSKVAETTNQSVVISNLDGIITYVNKSLLKTGGFDNETELSGKSIFDFSDEDGINKLNKEIIPTLFEKGTFTGELTFKRKDNSSYLGEMNCSLIFNEAGNPTNLVSMFSDISERKKQEEELKQSIQQTKIVMKGANIGWWDWHIPSGEEEYNDILPDLLAYKPDEVKPHISWWKNKIHADDLKQVGMDLEDHFNEKTDFYFNEHRLQTKNGEWKWFLDFGKVIERDEENKPIRMIGTLRDIDKQKRTQQQLEKQNSELIIAKEKAEESDKLKSAFLANMSHEIRTPMNGILGFTQLLKEPDLTTEEREEFINVIERGGNRMLNTINDIIDISQIETGQMETTLSNVNIEHELSDICNFFIIQAKSKGLILSLDYNIPQPNLIINSDITKLNSIITNLIKNAIKYTRHGSIIVSAHLSDSEHLKISIKDTGIGVPTNRLNAIFNRFEQESNTDARAFEGSGLGLAISKSYVKMLNGEIGVESVLGKGSTFFFIIPI